jgi:hypothetical protein
VQFEPNVGDESRTPFTSCGGLASGSYVAVNAPVPEIVPRKVVDVKATGPSCPTNWRVAQSSCPTSAVTDVVPELSVTSDASGGKASVRAPAGARRRVMGALVENATGELGATVHWSMPVYTPGAQSAS